MKVVNTETLKTLQHRAAKNQFNRQVSETFLDNLDAEGLHLVNVVLPFHNADFASIPHHRCEILAKFTGQDDPTVVMLDVATDDFEALTPVEKVFG